MPCDAPIAGHGKMEGRRLGHTAARERRNPLVFFAPEKTDYQTFHDENEYYFIARGSGELMIDGERFPTAAGNAFFVPAKVPHHFENFTDDFATWALFF